MHRRLEPLSKGWPRASAGPRGGEPGDGAGRAGLDLRDRHAAGEISRHGLACTWAGAEAHSVLMSVWRTCWQQGRSAVDFLSQLLRSPPAALAGLAPVNGRAFSLASPAWRGIIPEAPNEPDGLTGEP
jgi:hypothetical protein